MPTEAPALAGQGEELAENELDRLTEEEFLTARRLALRPSRKRLLVVAPILAVWGVAIVYGTVRAVGTGEDWGPTLFVWLVAAYAAWWFLVALPREGRRLYRQMRGELDGRSVLTALSLVMNRGKGPEVAFERVRRWREQRGLLLIFPRDDMFHVIPHRWLRPAEIEQLRTALRAHVGPAG